MKKTPLSPYQETLGLIYFARMLDKIRLQARGELAGSATHPALTLRNNAARPPR
jgi:hypothetical protein